MGRKRQEWIVGMDEVGRGALAGPVVVAAAAVPRGFRPRSRALGELKDSKKLTAARREAWCAAFRGYPALAFAVARVYPRQIERRNIANAANVAAERAFGRLASGKLRAADMLIFLDGGLYLGNGRRRNRRAKTVIKGDEKIAAIKIASIFAKVHRDRFMRRLAKRYPGYGFEVHKGYGTRVHRAAIARHGPSPAHRLTFIGKSFTIRT